MNSALMPRVSLTMIVRNAAGDLPRALATTADLVDEIVIVDTGSDDDTREIAAAARDRHGGAAKLFEFAWRDDFCAARNESLRHATGEWIFWMDADDWLDEANRRALAELFAGLSDANVVYQMWHTSPEAADGGHPASVAAQDRLFRNLPGIRWQGRVHEQIVPAVVRSGGVVRSTEIAILHSGYEDASVRQQKLARNLRLLEIDRAERPDDPYLLFYLGMTYAMSGRPAEALPCLERSRQRLPGRSRYLPRLFLLAADCWRLLGHSDRALQTCRDGLAAFPQDSALAQFESELMRSP